MEKIKPTICYHPELRPTDLNQPRPEPCEMIVTCECGANQMCPVCGCGFGTYPCPCTTKYMKENPIQIISDDYNKIISQNDNNKIISQNDDEVIHDVGETFMNWAEKNWALETLITAGLNANAGGESCPYKCVRDIFVQKINELSKMTEEEIKKAFQLLVNKK